MTTAAEYRDRAECQLVFASGDTDDPGYHLARAQVYATLAVSAQQQEAMTEAMATTQTIWDETKAFAQGQPLRSRATYSCPCGFQIVDDSDDVDGFNEAIEEHESHCTADDEGDVR